MALKFVKNCRSQKFPVICVEVIGLIARESLEMPPQSKKQKTDSNSSSMKTDELESFQNEIQKIKTVAEEDDYKEYIFTGDPLTDSKSNIQTLVDDDIRKYIREQIRQSENRIIQRCDKIEQKINRLLECQLSQPIEEEVDDDEEEEGIEEHLVEFVDPDPVDSKVDPSELDSRLFPITDEATFDWFFDKLKDEDYRNALILRRWSLTRSCSPKSVSIAVKDFLKLHFELPVVVKYSISGFGAHGIRKKKLDSNSLIIYVYECFSRSLPSFHTYQDISKAIVQFWGRAPDNLNKANERALKRDMIP